MTEWKTIIVDGKPILVVDTGEGNFFGKRLVDPKTLQIYKVSFYGGYSRMGTKESLMDNWVPIIRTIHGSDYRFDKANRHDYGKGEVEYSTDAAGRPIARYKTGDTRWYEVAEGSTGYDRNGNHNILKNGKWVPINENSRTTRTAANLSQSNYVPGAQLNGNQLTLARRGNLGPNAYNNIKRSFVDNGINKDFESELLANGWDGSAQSLQNAMYQIAKNRGYNLFTDLTRFADGKWGSESLSLFDFLHLDYPRNGGNLDEVVVTAPKPQPNFGYRSNVDYEAMSPHDFRSKGIRDYNSLMNYIKANPDDALSRDLTKAISTKLGNDMSKWNQADVESLWGGNLGSRNNYGRRDRNRIYDWVSGQAGTWNAVYDTNKYNYENRHAQPANTLPQLNNVNFEGEGSTTSDYNNDTFLDWSKNMEQKYPFLKAKYKTGGRLISKDPVKRFKKYQWGGPFTPSLSLVKERIKDVARKVINSEILRKWGEMGTGISAGFKYPDYVREPLHEKGAGKPSAQTETKKNKSLRKRTQETKEVNTPNLTYSINDLNIVPFDKLQLPVMEELSKVTAPIQQIEVYSEPHKYTRKEVRQYLRNQGVNPYSLDSSHRRALRYYLNGKRSYAQNMPGEALWILDFIEE